jgi:uncharacterized protein
MDNHPALLIAMVVIGIYVMYLWRDDYRSSISGRPNPNALPGATPCSLKASLIASLGALVILTSETLGELYLGLSEQQSKITILAGIYSLSAAFIEELIFRGFIVIENKGKHLKWAGIFAASLLFAVLHPFLWNWENGINWTVNAKGWFSTSVVFVSSIWFYIVRFASFNPKHSLIPAISAHATKNLGVIIIKAYQGFLTGCW